LLVVPGRAGRREDAVRPEIAEVRSEAPGLVVVLEQAVVVDARLVEDPLFVGVVDAEGRARGQDRAEIGRGVRIPAELLRDVRGRDPRAAAEGIRMGADRFRNVETTAQVLSP